MRRSQTARGHADVVLILFNSFENIRCSLQRKGDVLYWGAIFVRQLKNARPVGKLGTAVLCGRCVEGSGRLVDVVVFAMVSVAVVVAVVARVVR